MAQRQFQKGIIRENTRGQRQILIPVQVHTSSSHSHQTYEGDSELDQERITLINELNEWKVRSGLAQSKCIHLQDHLDKFDDFIVRYNELNREHDDLVAACEQREAEFREIELRLQEAENELNSHKEENAELNNQLKKRKTEMTELQKKHSEELQKREEELEEVKQSLSRQSTEQKKRRKVLQVDITRLNDRNIDLEAENKRLQDALDRYKRQIAGLKAAIADYQSRDDSFVVQPAVPPPSRREKSSQSESYLKLQLEQLAADLRVKQQDLEEQQAKQAERLAKLRAEMEQLKKQLRQSKSRCEELVSLNSELNSTKTDLSETIERLEKEIESLRSRKTTEKCNHLPKIKALEEQIQRLKDQIKDQSMDQGEQHSEEMHRLRQQLREDKTTSKKTISGLEKTIAGLERTIAGLESNIKELQDQLKEERTENSRLVDLLDKREKELAALHAEASKPKEPAASLTDRENDEQYQRMLRELKRDIEQKNASHKKLVQQLQSEITQLKNRLHRQSTIDSPKAAMPSTPPPLPKPASKPTEECLVLKDLLDRKEKQLAELRCKYEQLQKLHTVSLARLEQENLQLIRVLENERIQWSSKEQALSESSLMVTRLEEELARLTDDLESLQMRHCNSSMAFKQKENRLALLERRLQKSEDCIMREDERQLYEAKLRSKNELIELLQLKLRNIEQEWVRMCGPPTHYFY